MRTPEKFKIRGDQKMESPGPFSPVLMRFPKISPREYTELYKKGLKPYLYSEFYVGVRAFTEY